jgi:hypothetical protein
LPVGGGGGLRLSVKRVQQGQYYKWGGYRQDYYRKYCADPLSGHRAPLSART